MTSLHNHTPFFSFILSLPHSTSFPYSLLFLSLSLSLSLSFFLSDSLFSCFYSLLLLWCLSSVILTLSVQVLVYRRTASKCNFVVRTLIPGSVTHSRLHSSTLSISTPFSSHPFFFPPPFNHLSLATHALTPLCVGGLSHPRTHSTVCVGGSRCGFRERSSEATLLL